MSAWFKDAVGYVKHAFGGIQAEINLGGGQPSSARIELGEQRVMSVAALIAVGVVAYLLATRGRG